MGDSKASILIKFSIYGKEFEHEFWINWCANNDGIDDRIVEWFRLCANEAKAKWERENFYEENQ